jgi:hypothetical protein
MRLVILLGMLCVSAPLAAQSGPGGAQAEAERFARELLAARTPTQAERLVTRVLERVGIGVYDIVGTPVVAGNEEDADAFYLYDFEVTALATVLTRGTLIPLDGLVQEIRNAGLTMQPASAPAPVAFSSGEVERALRALRARAESERNERDWFLILLVDALGDRDEFPFSLLEEADEPKDSALPATGRGALEELFSRELQLAHDEAVSEGDREAAARIAAMMQGAGRDAAMQAMLEGDLGAIMRMLAGEEAAAELEAYGRELLVEAESRDTDPETRELLRSAGTMLGQWTTPGRGTDLVIMEHALHTLEAGRAALAAEIRDGLGEWERNRQQARDASSAGPLLDGLAHRTADLAFLAWRQNELELYEEFIEEQRRVVEDRAAWERASEATNPAFGLPWEEEEEEDRSELLLDPLQAVLVAADLLLQPRPRRLSSAGAHSAPYAAVRGVNGVAGAAGGAHFAGGPDAVSDNPPVGAAAGCQQIGAQGSAYADAVGTLERLLGIAGAARSTFKELSAQGVKGALESVLGGIVNFATVDLQVSVRYLPDDSGGDPVRGYTHLRHHRDDSRRIEITAQLEDLIPNLLPGALRNAAAGSGASAAVCGVARELAGAVGGAASDLLDLADHVERLLNGQDFSGTPVFFEPGGEAWEVLEVRPGDWQSLRSASRTFINRSDAAGRTTGVFYPAVEQPDLGGTLELVRVPVRVQAVLPESDKLWRSYGALGIRVLEEIFQPVQRWAIVNVERHRAVPVIGQVELVRTVSEVGSARTAGEDERSAADRQSNWSVRVRFDETVVASPDQGGRIPGPGGMAAMDVRVQGSWNTTIVDEWLTGCDGADTWLKRTHREEGDLLATGAATLPAPGLHVDSKSGTYAVTVGYSTALLNSALANGAVTGGRDVSLEHISCDGRGTDSYSDDVRDISEGAFRILTAPVVIPLHAFPEFPRGTSALNGSATWEERYPSELVRRLRLARGEEPDATYDVTTTVTWRLRRAP